MDEEIQEQDFNGMPIDILLVEDNEADVKITLRAFSKAKLKNNIFVVYNGEEAIEFVYHQGKYKDAQKFPRPDLILLDINMPKMNGLEVLEKIKADDQFKKIPVIMLTSSKDDSDIEKCYSIGASSYIQKPVGYEDFLKVVEGFNFYWHIINKLPDGKKGN